MTSAKKGAGVFLASAPICGERGPSGRGSVNGKSPAERARRVAFDPAKVRVQELLHRELAVRGGVDETAEALDEEGLPSVLIASSLSALRPALTGDTWP